MTMNQQYDEAAIDRLLLDVARIPFQALQANEASCYIGLLFVALRDCRAEIDRLKQAENNKKAHLLAETEER